MTRTSDPCEPVARRALDELCRLYWLPLYAFVRRSGSSHHEAEDLTQGFFSHLLEKELFARAEQHKGRLRSFLLAALKNYLVNRHHECVTLKRGGNRTHVPLSVAFDEAENRIPEIAIETESPESAFERQWALTVLDSVLQTLRREYRTRDKERLFDALKPALTCDPDARSYRETAEELHLSEGAVKVAVHRLRHRYRRLLEASIAETVSTPDEVGDELQHLIRTVSKRTHGPFG